MKITIDLSETVLREIELRALNEGRTFNEVVVSLLIAGLSQVVTISSSHIGADPKNLPLIKTRPAEPLTDWTFTAQEWCDWIKVKDGILDEE